MKVEKEFAVPFPAERVWAFFHDTAAVVNCLPGAELGEAGEKGALKGRFRVKLGPITAAFAGEGRLSLDEAQRTGALEGFGSDRGTGTRAKGKANFALFEAQDGNGTRVNVSVEYTLAGALAQFGRGGIVEDLAGRLAGEFAANLEKALSSEAPAAAAGPIKVGRLFSGAIRDRLRRKRSEG